MPDAIRPRTGLMAPPSRSETTWEAWGWDRSGRGRRAQTSFDKLLGEARQMAWDLGVGLRAKVVPGHEVETIVTAARDGKFDLLAVGFAGHSNVFGRVMGSTTQNLSHLSPCSVLIVK